MLIARIRRFFIEHAIAPCRVAAAVSGGVDSSALLLALMDLRKDGYAIECVHVNHHLRGADSDADEQFVRELCSRLEVPLHVMDGTLDPERVRARGIEAAAREVRYARFREIGADYVATAHQKNDQAETVLMRLLTGSGMAGLRGIHPLRGDGIIRPLLEVTRAEIEAFLGEHGIVPRVDRSNDDPRFLRNRIRALLREIGGIDALANVAEQARSMWPILEKAIDEAERTHVEIRDDETRFKSWPEDPWLRGALLQRHIRRLDPEARDYDATRIAEEVTNIKRASITKNLELTNNVLRRPPQPTEDFEIELTPNTPAFIPQLGITMHLRQPTTDNRQQFELPQNADPTFTVRNRRAGDRFQPLGMAMPKKLKDFLIDRKIAADLRDRLPLLVWNGEIVWVAGVEVSERFKVTGAGGALYEVWMDETDQAPLQR